jgi:transposase-like protein
MKPKYCPLCKSELHFVGNLGDVYIYRSKCPKCKMQMEINLYE